MGLDNHRNDDWKPYLYKTTDYGKSWTTIATNLPVTGPITALCEDPQNPNLLFVGTEFGLYVSMDGGKNWKKFMSGMPAVPVYELLIHPRDRDLLVATHGRSLWIADDITALEQFAGVGSQELVLFDPRPAIQWKNDYADYRSGGRGFRGENPQGGTAISVYSKSDLGSGKVEFLQNGQVVSTMDVRVDAGMNRFQWNMQKPAPAAAGGRGGRGGGGGGRGRGGAGGVPFVSEGRGNGGGAGSGLVEPGGYVVRLTVGGTTRETSVVVLEDAWMQSPR